MALDGRPLYHEGFIEDITGRKRMQDALRKSESKFSKAFRSNPAALGLCDIRDGFRFLDVNEAFEQTTGYRREELIGSTIDGLQLSPDPARLTEAQELLRTDGRVRNFEYHFRRKNGDIGTGLLSIDLIEFDGKPCALSATMDITGRKRAESLLGDSETLLRASQRIAGLGSYVMDTRTGSWTSSEVMDEIFGIDESFDRSTEGWISLVHPDWRGEMAEYFYNWVLQERKRFDKEYRIVRPNDGQVRWVHGLGGLDYDTAGQPARMVGTIQDITARKVADSEKQRD